MPAKKKTAKKTQPQQVAVVVPESANLFILNSIARKVDALSIYIASSNADVNELINNHSIMV